MAAVNFMVKCDKTTVKQNKKNTFTLQPLRSERHRASITILFLPTRGFLLLSVIQPAEVLLETSTMPSLVRSGLSLNTRRTVAPALAGMFPFYRNGGGEGTKEGRPKEKRDTGIKRVGDRKESVTERKERGWKERGMCRICKISF